MASGRRGNEENRRGATQRYVVVIAATRRAYFDGS
jgi:hypothetical protein